MSTKASLRVLILGLGLTNVAIAARTPVQIAKDIGANVICMCGCRSALSECPDQHCTSRAKM